MLCGNFALGKFAQFNIKLSSSDFCHTECKIPTIITFEYLAYSGMEGTRQTSYCSSVVS